MKWKLYSVEETLLLLLILVISGDIVENNCDNIDNKSRECII